ncbi:hypothetical protein LCGC14_2806540, partial [marine sediment metagenome]
IKDMAGLDQGQCRRSQDGDFGLTMDGREIRFRVATCPMVDGERMAIHVIDPDRALPGLSDLLSEAHERRIRGLLAEPCGVILVAAPSRRERTTVLWAMVEALNCRERNIVVVETSTGPTMAGVNRSRTQPSAGYSFAEAVDALAGQDPDVVMVDGVRSSPAAAALVDLARDGTMVLVGMGGRSPATAASTFAEMCGQGCLLSSALLAVIEQRAVRRLCADCRTQTAASEELLATAGLKGLAFPVYVGAGCPRCANTGYAGTAVLSAILEVDQAVARCIRLGLDADAFERASPMAGPALLRKAALESLQAGTTSLEEIVRALPRR